MSAAFAVGLAIGAGVVVFGRDTAPARRALLQLHLLAARLGSRRRP